MLKACPHPNLPPLARGKEAVTTVKAAGLNQSQW